MEGSAAITVARRVRLHRGRAPYSVPCIFIAEAGFIIGPKQGRALAQFLRRTLSGLTWRDIQWPRLGAGLQAVVVLLAKSTAAPSPSRYSCTWRTWHPWPELSSVYPILQPTRKVPRSCWPRAVYRDTVTICIKFEFRWRFRETTPTAGI